MQILPIPAERHSQLFQQLETVCPADAELLAITAAPAALRLQFTTMLAAYRDERLVGAAWCRELPGKLVRVWSPRVGGREPDATADQLLAAIHQQIPNRDGWLAQALLPSSVGSDVACLTRHEYRHAADLVVMAAAQHQAPTTCPASELTFVRADSTTDRARLRRLLEQTYRGTLDIPALNGLRSSEDVLDGYEQSAESAARIWFLALLGKRPVGCLLLADLPDRDELELVYLGLAPEARGRGWGWQLVRHAQWRARHLGRSQVILAVDGANEPAKRIYSAAGFLAYGRHCLFIRAMKSDSTTQPFQA